MSNKVSSFTDGKKISENSRINKIFQLQQEPIQSVSDVLEPSFSKMDVKDHQAIIQWQENDTYQVTYYMKNALKASIIHWSHLLLGPFSIPILYTFFTRHLLKNMYFRPSKVYFMVELPPWMWLWMSLVLIYFNQERESYYLPYFATAGTVIIIRTILVSIKYGYYTKYIWRKMNSKELDEADLRENILFFSWINVPQEIALKELRNSYLRQHLNPDQLWLHFQCPNFEQCFDKLKETADKLNLESDKIQYQKVSTLVFSQCLTCKVIQKVKTSTSRKILTFVCFLYSLLPVFMNISVLQNAEQLLNIMDLTYIIMNILVSLLLSRTFLTFILAGVYDFRRRKLMMAQCSALISHVDNKYLYLDRNMAKLDLTHVSTILSWYHMRAAFLDYGKRFTLRLFLYTSLIFPVCLLVIVVLFLMVFDVIGKQYNFYFMPWLYLTAVVMAILTNMTLSAVSLNKYFAVHRDIILSHVAMFRNKYKQENELAVKVLEFVVQKLYQDEVLHPVKILGITMDSNFITKLFAVGVSGIFAALRVFYSN